MKRWLWWSLVLVGVVLAFRLVARIPWSETAAAFTSMRLSLLLAALLVNLLSPLAKGSAWHWLLRPVAPHSWRAAQEANLLGTAVSSVSVGVTGEAARVSMLARIADVPAGTTALSVAWSRVVEGIGLALLLVLAPLLLHLPPALRGLQIGSAVALAAVIAMSRFQRWAHLIARLPRAVRGSVAQLARMSLGTRLFVPVLLALGSWFSQWATYALVLAAAGLPLRAGASLTALLAVNLSGIGRLTPANLGVTQAAMVGALLPFGAAPEQAIAAGLALQAIQVLPVLGLTALVVGVQRLRLRNGRADLEQLHPDLEDRRPTQGAA